MQGWMGRKPQEVTDYWATVENLPAEKALDYRHWDCTLCDSTTALTPSNNKCICIGVTQLVEFITGNKHWCIPSFSSNYHSHPIRPFQEFHCYLCYNRMAHRPGTHRDAPTADEWQAWQEALGPVNSLRREQPVELQSHHLYDSIHNDEIIGLDAAAVNRIRTYRVTRRALMVLLYEVPHRTPTVTIQHAPLFGG